MITDINQLDTTQTYTYAQYLTWRFAERVELIKGRLFKMSPAPARKHQDIVSNLHWLFKVYSTKKKCKVYTAPFDVRFPNTDKNEVQTFTVIQPDITVICDLSKLDDKGCVGAPDLIVEIISPSTAQRDVKYKYELYEENGVREYWIVYPDLNFVDVFLLEENQKYRLAGRYTREDSIKVGIFDNLEIALADVFEDEEPIADNPNEIRI